MAEQKSPLENLMIMSQRLDQLDGQFDWSDEIQQIRAALSHAEGAQHLVDASVTFVDGLGASRNKPSDCREGLKYITAGPITYWPLSTDDEQRLRRAECGDGEFHGPTVSHAEGEAGWRSGYPECDGDGGVCHIPLDGHPDFMVVAFNRDGNLVDSCGDDVGYSLEDVERWRPIDAPTAPQVAVPEGWALVPVESTEKQWGGLARDLMMWLSFQRPTGAKLHEHLRTLERDIPQWLIDEIPDVDHVPSKGTRAAVVYRAMLAAAPTAPAGESDDSDICERVELPHVLAWADGVRGDMRTEYADRITDEEARVAQAVWAAHTGEQPVSDPDGLTEPGRREAEQAYINCAFDYARDPIGSRDWVLFWNGWRARNAAPAPDEREIAARAILGAVDHAHAETAVNRGVGAISESLVLRYAWSLLSDEDVLDVGGALRDRLRAGKEGQDHG